MMIDRSATSVKYCPEIPQQEVACPGIYCGDARATGNRIAVMAKICERCSRRQPSQAAYCYFDGTALAGTDQARHQEAGCIEFPRPFVHFEGEACRNFNQFVMACQAQWDRARELLVAGTLRDFFAQLGRFDLVEAAQIAERFPNADRGLDQLLERVPNEVLQPAKLLAEPTSVNLGQIRGGADASFELGLVNQGMHLLYGAVAADCDWLLLGDPPAQRQKLFQTPHEVQVRVRAGGDKLRARAAPYEGRLHIDSNAGKVTINVRLEWPVHPFPTGVLAGALTPREIAQKAKQFPREAAAIFEQGDVERWYKSNGWSYPVEGQTGSGIGAVQQFFEALGLTKPPKVAISDNTLSFFGFAGQRLEHRLKISTRERKPVFAHGHGDQSWLQVGEPKFQGAEVSLPIIVDVPSQSRESLQGKVIVRANGNQRFVVPVDLKIAEKPGRAKKSPPPLPIETAEPAPGRRRERTGSTATFGMTRFVYWSGIVGAWAAFSGWLVSEVAFGRWVGDSMLLAILMIVIVAGALGAALSQVEALITRQWAKQRRFLLPGLIGGLLGGLVGGLLGNFFYLIVGGRFMVLEFLGRVTGWTLIGLAIGVCEGGFELHWRKLRNGMIGGTLGGFLGGVVFGPVSYLVGSPMSSRAVAFVLLGLFVGLFLGLVQVLLKEAWLTVEQGFRPGRQLILDQAVTTMGTSEKAGLIFIAYGAKGVEPIHARIRRREDGAYVVEDNQSRGGTLLNDEPVEAPMRLRDGDVIQLGINKVCFSERLRS